MLGEKKNRKKLYIDKEIEKETGRGRINKKRKKAWLNEKVRGKKRMCVGKALKKRQTNIIIIWLFFLK